MGTTHKFVDATAARGFMLAGNARFTVVSLKTKKRFTFRVRACEDRPALFFVSLLAGPDNESSFVYLGIVRDRVFSLTKKSKLTLGSDPVLAFKWTWDHLRANVWPADVAEFWHEGACGRCGRTLTVPESIASGFGPECVKHVGADRAVA